MEHLTILDASKTATFQMRINPDAKSQLERLYANCGMSMTDAINIFFPAIHQCGWIALYCNAGQ